MSQQKKENDSTKGKASEKTVIESLSSTSAKNAMTEFFRMSESSTEGIGEILNLLNLRLCVAESCTGGLLGAAITQVSGVSSWFEGGFITYSNEAKQKHINVDAKTLEKYGAVSALTVCQMASGACEKSSSQVGLSISGIAGPDGGTKDKPVGTVWIGLRVPKNLAEYKEKHSQAFSRLNSAVHGSDYSWIMSAQLLKNAYCIRETPVLTIGEGEVIAREFHFEGDRTSVRQSAVFMALYFAYEYLSK